jgi:hypothetical protein
MFEEGVNVIASYELGPVESNHFTEGHIFYAEKSFSNDETTLNITSSPNDARFYLDDQLIGNTPLTDYEIDLQSRHSVRLEKEGYETIEFTILPDSQSARDRLKGYELNLEINMFRYPLNIIEREETSNGEE